MAEYKYTKAFNEAFIKNTGLKLDEDTRAYILMICNTSEPHKKIDDKGRTSAYFTCLIQDEPVTIVTDYVKEKIITAVKENHKAALRKSKLI